MADVILTTDTVGEEVLDTNFDIYFLKEGVLHYNSSGAEGTLEFGGGSTNRTVIVNGTMTNFTGGVIKDVSSATPVDSVLITVSDTGTIQATGNYRAIELDGDDIVINNNGEIVGGEAIRIGGDKAEIYNNGLITGFFGGSTASVEAIILEGDNAVLVNTGTILGETAVRFDGTATVNNAGTIAGDVYGVEFNAFGTDDVTFSNSGSLSGLGRSYWGSGGVDTVDNSGSISGDMDLGNGADVFTNTGDVLGDVDMGAGDDTLVNSGTIAGDLYLDTGADYYKASGLGAVTGVIEGGFGDDTILGGEADETITGGDHNDVLRGNGGEDEIFGDFGDDSINGGHGDDTVEGGNGNDTLRGSGGDDIIYGDSGNDKMYGGAGADEIIGGIGKDVMRGNGGADTFIFETEFDANTTTAVDRIRDFQQGLDKIDISLITGFTFVGDSSFSGTGSEVRYQTTNSGLRFEMDVDGDGNADMRVNMNGISDLLESDFIL